MYKVSFTKEIYSLVRNNLRSEISQRDGWRLARAEEAEFSTIEVWQDVIHTLQNNPFAYPEYTKGVFLAIELYLPYILAYTIMDNEVIIFKAILREEVYL